MKLKTVAVALVAAFGITSAYANSIAYTDLGELSVGEIQGFGGSFSDLTPDYYSFTLPISSQVDGFAFAFNKKGVAQDFSLFLDDSSTAIFSSSTLAETFSTVLSGGSHTFHLTGLGTYGGEIMNIAAVPEPETYAMFLAGLGLMGFVGRRRGIK